MNSRDFVYWLQGYFELMGNVNLALSQEQTFKIKQHLALVFKHEIDPSAGTGSHQKELNDIHNQPSPFADLED